MATDCYTQLGFGFQPKFVVDFAFFKPGEGSEGVVEDIDPERVCI